MFDLDNLKQINDTFGHDWGDEYIRRTGECFAKNAPARTVCARISSDEFNALFYGYNDQDTLRADIRALKAALEHSVVQLPSGRELRVSVSGGVAWYPESSTNLITLRKYADFAMYQVKLSRKGELLEFDPEVYRTSLQERRCHEEFRHLINEELVTYRFQPIIDAKTAASSPMKRSCAWIFHAALPDGRAAPRARGKLLARGRAHHVLLCVKCISGA